MTLNAVPRGGQVSVEDISHALMKSMLPECLLTEMRPVVLTHRYSSDLISSVTLNSDLISSLLRPRIS